MSIEALRAKLREAQQRSQNNQKKSSGGGDKASFPFWDTPVGQTTTVRFLPDADQNNPFFWVERQVIKLPFDGVVGGEYPTQKPVEVTVPCIDMFGQACPIIAATKHLWEEGKTNPDALQLARQYYKKRSYIFQGLVVNSPIVEEEAPENQIRRFVINKSIYDIIYASLLEPNFESLPTDYEGGRDFSIKKTQKGEWANYGTSNWSYNPRALSEAERAAVEKFGLFNLKDALGAVPTADGVAAIKAMFEDSFAGKPFDHESYGQYYRPYGSRDNSGAAAQTAATTAAATTMAAPTVTESAPAAPAAATETPAPAAGVTGKEGAQAIIDRLRANSAKLNQ
jgi:hypothetical protein